MNAVPKVESAQDGARRLFGRDIADGFKPVALHCYADADGVPLFYRARLKHEDGRKVIKPIRLDGLRFALGEPPAPAQGKPLYRLPELLAADPAALVWIVEGEGCADALHGLGMVGVTSGSATSDNAADWQPMHGRHCVLWPDNNKPGADYATRVAERLQALGCTVEVIDIDTLQLPVGGDVVDWLVQHPGATAADVITLPRDTARAAPKPGKAPATAPEPLRRPVPPPEPYPVKELGPILAPACESLRRVIQAPDAICGASLLAAASLAVQGLADVTNSGRVHPLSLWFLSVAESGERKSAVDSEAMRPAREYEKGLASAYDAEAEAHRTAMEEWEARCSKARSVAKKVGGMGLADALREIGPAPPPPLRPIVIAADFTAEGLAKLLAAGLPSMGAFTDEAALVFGGHGMSKETVTRTAGTLCKLWDSGSLDRIRAGDGPVKLYGRRLALHLMGQPVIAERALSDDVLAGQGFLARCLLAWPQSTAGSRPYCSEILADDAALIHYRARAADLLARPLPMAHGARNELAPPLLSLSPEAFQFWEVLHNTIEAQMAPGGSFATVKPWASKTPEQALRIAGVLTLFENADARAIDAATMERAAELALWHLGEAARLAGTAALSPEVRDAEALLAWAHESRHARVYSTMALNRGPARIREVESFRQAMGELERAGWAMPIEGGAMMDGRHRRHVWDVLPQSSGGE